MISLPLQNDDKIFQVIPFTFKERIHSHGKGEKCQNTVDSRYLNFAYLE